MSETSCCPFLVSFILGGSLLLWKEIFEVSSNWVWSHSYPQSGEMCLRRTEPSGSKGLIYPPHSSERDSWICPLFFISTAISLVQAGLLYMAGYTGWALHNPKGLPFTQSTMGWHPWICAAYIFVPLPPALRTFKNDRCYHITWPASLKTFSVFPQS